MKLTSILFIVFIITSCSISGGNTFPKQKFTVLKPLQIDSRESTRSDTYLSQQSTSFANSIDDFTENNIIKTDFAADHSYFINAPLCDTIILKDSTSKPIVIKKESRSMIWYTECSRESGEWIQLKKKKVKDVIYDDDIHKEIENSYDEGMTLRKKLLLLAAFILITDSLFLVLATLLLVLGGLFGPFDTTVFLPRLLIISLIAIPGLIILLIALRM